MAPLIGTAKARAVTCAFAAAPKKPFVRSAGACYGTRKWQMRLLVLGLR